MNPYAPRFPLWFADDDVDRWSVTIDVMSDMCPRSHNPREGSRVTLTLSTLRGSPEIAAVVGFARAAMTELVGGFDGDETAPATRSMEGAIEHIALRVSQAMRCDVRADALLKIQPPARDQPVVELCVVVLTRYTG